MAQLRLNLLKEEAKQTSSAGGMSVHKVSAGAFFRKAIEIEDRLWVSFSFLYLLILIGCIQMHSLHENQSRGY